MKLLAKFLTLGLVLAASFGFAQTILSQGTYTRQLNPVYSWQLPETSYDRRESAGWDCSYNDGCKPIPIELYVTICHWSGTVTSISQTIAYTIYQGGAMTSFVQSETPVTENTYNEATYLDEWAYVRCPATP